MTIRWHATYSAVYRGDCWAGLIETVTVTNTMDPSRSWVVASAADDRLLAHEQLHFDLNEVYRRKLETMLTDIHSSDSTKQGALDALHNALHRLANQVLRQLEHAQADYDGESCHGNDPLGQVRWATQIRQWLEHPADAP